MELTSWQSQLRKGAAELVVLSLLGEAERYGLDILEQANRHGEIVSEGSLYPLLNRLEKDGKLVSRWVVTDSPNPRKYYRATPEGERLLASMLLAWTEFRTAMSAVVERDR